MRSSLALRCVGWLLLSLPVLAPVGRAMDAVGLRCEGTIEPLGVDAPQPRLGWTLRSDRRGDTQSAYRIVAASSPEALAADRADLWDSGKVSSAESLNVRYAGRPPRAAQEIFWKVRAWNGDDAPSGWSEPARWTEGLLDPADWQPARWIASETDPSPATVRFRREIEVRPKLRRAVIFVCGLGQYELTIDGVKPTDDLLAPGWTKYDKTCLYDVRDVTAQLRRDGRHALGILLGNGMYNVEKTDRYTKFTGSFGPQKVITLLRLEYADGTTETIGTDTRWRAAAGPLTYSHVYGGEDHDARLEARGWDSPSFDESGWRQAATAEGPGGVLRGSASLPPIRAQEVLRPVSVKTLRPGVSVYDLGQNASLMPRLQVRGAAGAVVRVVPAELLNPDGSVDRRSSGNKIAYWQYTLAGDPHPEVYFPKFFYHGCRYLQVECVAPADGGQPVVESVEGVVVGSTARPAGTFSCSNELFNRIYGLVRWAQRSNLVSVLTDCPHRERLGWLEQTHLNGPALRYNFDLTGFFEKVVGDMADSQTAAGLVPSITPEYVQFGGDFRDSPEWGGAFVMVAWQQYEWTGDLELFRRHYDGMARYVAYLGTKAKDHIVSYGLSDWYDIGPGNPGRSKLTPNGVTATAFYYQQSAILARVARLLGKTADAAKFEAQSEAIRAAFNAKFLDAADPHYATNSQCANALPLVMGIAPPDNRAAIISALARDVEQKGLTAGDVGYQYLLRALADAGRSDLIYTLNNQSEKPGYGLQLARGATSLTEAWDAHRTSSQNHFMLGQINEWFFHDLAGIQPDPQTPGFGRVVIKPAVVGDLSFVKASFDSVRGQIVSEWQRSGRAFSLRVVIPANTAATVWMPASSAASVQESGRPVSGAGQIRLLRTTDDAAVYEIGSGEYHFTSQL